MSLLPGSRRILLGPESIEIGARFGPLAGEIWQFGLTGASSTPRLIVLRLAASESALATPNRSPQA